MVEIPVGRDGLVTALVDDEDAVRVGALYWRLNRAGYVVRGRKDAEGHMHLIWLHRFILGVSDRSVMVDHMNRNKLDNRSSNLRFADARINAQNRSPLSASGRRGVTFHRQTGKWQAGISVNRRFMYLGLYEDIEVAAKVASEARLLHFPGTVEL